MFPTFASCSFSASFSRLIPCSSDTLPSPPARNLSGLVAARSQPRAPEVPLDAPQLYVGDMVLLSEELRINTLYVALQCKAKNRSKQVFVPATAARELQSES
jgi:hypothetical protein